MSITDNIKDRTRIFGEGVKIKRTRRRAIGAHIRAYFERPPRSWAFYGLCGAVDSIVGRLITDDEALALIHDIGVGCSGRAYLPDGLEFPWSGAGDGRCLNVSDADQIEHLRRTWLRHWEETGEVLTAATWAELKAKRKALRHQKATDKKAAATLI